MAITIIEENMIVKIAETNTVVRVEKGLIGPQGIAGQGFPAGGTTNQVLRKISGDDYDTEWASVGSGDVSGPASVTTDGNIVLYNGTTGKIIKDSTLTLSTFEASILHTNIIAGDGTDHTMVRKHNFTATTNPTITDDSNSGYSVTSLWLNTVANGRITWICTDATAGAAVWEVISGEGLDATEITLHGKVNVAGGVTKGQIAYINGGTGAYKPTFGKGDRGGHDSSHISGLFKETKGDNQDVEVITKGKLIGTTATPLNTSTYSVGDRIHLGTNGNWIGETVGGGGSHIEIGRILRSHPSEGVIEVDIAKYVHSIKAYSGTGGIIELAIGSNGNTDWISFQSFDGTEFSKITTNGLCIDQINEYTSATGVTIDGILLKDNEIEADNIERMIFTGLSTWTGTGNYYDPTFPDGEFRLLRGGTGDIRSKKITFTAPQDTGVLTANNTHWIYIDSSGVLQSTTSRPDSLFEDNIVLFEVLYDGTNYIVVKEDHPSCFNQCVSNELHKSYNTVIADSGVNMVRVATGTGASSDDRKIKIAGASELLDHGLNTTIPDSGGSAVTFNHEYTNGSGNWVRDSLNTEFPMKYNNAGTPTPLGNLKFGVFTCYVSKDNKNSSTPLYFSVMHTAEFNSIALARTAINTGTAIATNELFYLELARIGYIIVQNNGAGGYIAEVEIDKQTLSGTSTGAGTTNISALISNNTSNFNNILGTGDTNVQNALETLDDHTIASHSDTTATGAELETLTDGSNASSLHTHDDASTTTKGLVELTTATEIDTGTDSTRAMPVDQFVASKRNLRHLVVDLVEKDTDVVGDDTDALYTYELQFSGTILQSDTDTDLLKAVVATAGVTGTMVVDVHYNGTTIMTTNKLDIETGETSTETAGTQPDLTTTEVEKGGTLTFFIDTAQTTPAKGCKVYITIRED
jgi:hypothetical protein